MCKQKQTITDNRSTLNAFPDKLVCCKAGKKSNKPQLKIVPDRIDVNLFYFFYYCNYSF